jgi:hypothetical protein
MFNKLARATRPMSAMFRVITYATPDKQCLTMTRLLSIAYQRFASPRAIAKLLPPIFGTILFESDNV